MIIHDPRNDKAVRLAAELERRLPAELDTDDLVFVVGGDGFLLQTVRTNGVGATYLPINAGYLGFLLNDVLDWDDVQDKLERRAWRVSSFPLIVATIRTGDAIVQELAINDVYLERMTGQLAHLQLTVGGELLVDRLSADGVVFSTALGSTGYSYSAGASACHPELDILMVTPICPHRPRLHPFALPATATIAVDVISAERRPVRAVADGRGTPHARHVELAIGADKVRIAYFDDHDFTSVMIRKILRS